VAAGNELVADGKIDGYECYTLPFTPFWFLREIIAGPTG
jgi:hypothetical protein